ncbi:MAG: cupin domain-containing protein [Terriglobales bacterium]|jgi:quercetin dioxygenase-like cupin family protein
MNSRRTVILAVATIILTAILRPTRANAQGVSVPVNPPRAHPVPPVVEGGNEASQEERSTQVMSKLLPDFPGKEVVILAVNYPPGHSGAVHRHKADGFIYVLEGSVIMGINGGDPITLGPGQTFYEEPNDIHTIGRNASKTKPARFLVFLIKDKDAPISMPAK